MSKKQLFVFLLSTFCFLLIQEQAQAQLFKKAKSEPATSAESKAPEKEKGVFAPFKKKTTEADAVEKDADLKEAHKDAKTEVRVYKKERKAAEAREEAARARAEAIKAQRKAEKADGKVEKAEKKVDKAKEKAGN
ncbi:MAG TPA: hypothetical protein PKA70_22590 [Saprospiraceae bacterium]|nr:hypothetical protein [Saprospiraceae bacterium]